MWKYSPWWMNLLKKIISVGFPNGSVPCYYEKPRSAMREDDLAIFEVDSFSRQRGLGMTCIGYLWERRLGGLSSALSSPGFVLRRDFQVLFRHHNRSANLFQKGWLYFPIKGKHFPGPLNHFKARFEKLRCHL